MRLDFVVLYSRFPDSLAAFYRAGLRLTERLRRFEGRYVELEAGGVTLAICDLALRNELFPQLADLDVGPLGTGAAQLSFAVDDVYAAEAQAVTAGAELISPTAVRPWRCEVAIVRDPDGRLIEFCLRLG